MSKKLLISRGNRYLDDLPPMMFIKASPNSHGWVNPKDVEELWLDHFNFFYREYDEFVFPVTVSQLPTEH